MPAAQAPSPSSAPRDHRSADLLPSAARARAPRALTKGGRTVAHGSVRRRLADLREHPLSLALFRNFAPGACICPGIVDRSAYGEARSPLVVSSRLSLFAPRHGGDCGYG